MASCTSGRHCGPARGFLFFVDNATTPGLYSVADWSKASFSDAPADAYAALGLSSSGSSGSGTGNSGVVNGVHTSVNESASGSVWTMAAAPMSASDQLLMPNGAKLLTLSAPLLGTQGSGSGSGSSGNGSSGNNSSGSSGSGNATSGSDSSGVSSLSSVPGVPRSASLSTLLYSPSSTAAPGFSSVANLASFPTLFNASIIENASWGGTGLGFGSGSNSTGSGNGTGSSGSGSGNVTGGASSGISADTSGTSASGTSGSGSGGPNSTWTTDYGEYTISSSRALVAGSNETQFVFNVTGPAVSVRGPTYTTFDKNPHVTLSRVTCDISCLSYALACLNKHWSVPQ